MKVQPVIGEFLRFRVQSEREPKTWYLVELDSERGKCISTCNCADYQFRIAPLLMRDYQSEFRACKHGKAALQCFAIEMVKRCSAELKNRQPVKA